MCQFKKEFLIVRSVTNDLIMQVNSDIITCQFMKDFLIVRSLTNDLMNQVNSDNIIFKNLKTAAKVKEFLMIAILDKCRFISAVLICK